jgi:uncharacterized membrane protein YhaH (DUF805 family)
VNFDDFAEAVKTCFAKYTNFSGRARRPEFWWFFLFQVLVFMVTGMISDMLYFLAALALLLPGLAVGARRLHDIGKSGWFLLLGFIPILGFLVLLYWFVQPSQGANQFGHPPVSSESTTMMPGQ